MYTHEQIDGYHALRLHQIVRGTNPRVTTVYAFANMVTQPSSMVLPCITRRVR